MQQRKLYKLPMQSHRHRIERSSTAWKKSCNFRKACMGELATTSAMHTAVDKPPDSPTAARTATGFLPPLLSELKKVRLKQEQKQPSYHKLPHCCSNGVPPKMQHEEFSVCISPSPITMGPKSVAPAPISTPSWTIGCRTFARVPEPPKVT
jgi:hypothetical protein